MSTASEREKIKNFVNLTGESDRVAQTYLKKVKWNLELAVDNYFNDAPSTGASSGPAVDQSKIRSLFSNYKGSEGIIEGEGLERFSKDLGISSDDDLALFALAWKSNAKQLGEFTESEFVEGLTKIRCDTLDKLVQKLPSLRDELRQESGFKEFYSFMFEYIKDKDQKSLSLELASELWPILLKEKFKFLDEWIKFLNANYPHRSISRDLWMQLYEFTKICGSELDSYNPDGAWPVVIDEFVESIRPSDLRSSQS